MAKKDKKAKKAEKKAAKPVTTAKLVDKLIKFARTTGRKVTLTLEGEHRATAVAVSKHGTKVNIVIDNGSATVGVGSGKSAANWPVRSNHKDMIHDIGVCDTFSAAELRKAIKSAAAKGAATVTSGTAEQAPAA